MSVIASTASNKVSSENSVVDPKSELDSHANMVVLGRNCFVFEWSGQSCNVQPFDSNLGSANNIPIVDAAIAYDCPYDHRTYILLVRNALYMPGLENNLLPPFILRQAGLQVNDTAKIHCADPTVDDHCITFPGNDLCIPLHLDGIFSFFHTCKPEDDELQSCDKMFITPDENHWNPYCTSFSLNEASMLTYDGCIADTNRQGHHVMEVDDESNGYVAVVKISDTDIVLDNVADSAFAPEILNVEENDDCAGLADALNKRGEISKMMGTVGSATVVDDTCEIFSHPSHGTIDALKCLLATSLGQDAIDTVEAQVKSAMASSSKGVTKDMLSKIWVVSEDLAQGAIDRNTQLCKHHADNSLSRQFSTND